MKTPYWRRNLRGWICSNTFLLMIGFFFFSLSAPAATNWVVIGWNNLGMHCMDNDFSVFCTLPPYNTIHAQLIENKNGQLRLMTNAAGYAVTYQAIADPEGSINKTSVGKGNFWQYASSLFGVSLAPEAGLPIPGPESFSMPGSNNVPQEMGFETNATWFAAYGIPITPYDEQYLKNAFPLMRLTVSNGIQQFAITDIVLPVSDEMDCQACHSSGGVPDAKPASGWAWDSNPSRDYRLNPLRLHDEKQLSNSLYAAALATNQYDAGGLYATVIRHRRPILCAACHLSEALPGSGFPDIKPLTTAIHSRHAAAEDPVTGQMLGASSNRTACYRCHPGSNTRCLRGAMGKAVSVDGALSMNCQDCHGSLSAVGSTNRTGWLNEPNCQACHTGDALSNNGQIRYENVFVTPGTMRTAVNNRFATNTNTPTPGLSLYRFSRGHGGLYCEACHGSTHAEFPSSFQNDNVASKQHQGHVGVLVECTSCHGVSPSTSTGGPHGMHPVGTVWVNNHENYGKSSNCQACHGTDERGTVLSRSHANWSVTAFDRRYTYRFWRGFQIGCYLCHQGSNNTDHNPNQPPVVSNLTVHTDINTLVNIPLHATDADGNTLTLRIVNQAAHGRVGLIGTTATYIPDTAFFGVDTFTFAAWDGSTDSNLATGTVDVAGGACVYMLNPTSQVFDELSHVGSVQISVSSGCPWAAASDCSWIQILTSGSMGPGMLLYGVSRNFGNTDRTGAVSIAGQTLTVVQAGSPPDGNSDGIPDIWQTSYFGFAGSTNATPDADPDGDGANNLGEYLAGTVPTDNSSVLRIASFAPYGANFQLGIPTISNRYYHIQRTENLLDPEWMGFTNAFFGIGETFYLTDATTTNILLRYYRAQIAY